MFATDEEESYGQRLSAARRGKKADSFSSSLAIRDRHNVSKINWHYLYTQRRRLEYNWEFAKYVSFRLPDLAHPEDAHEGCIYALQYDRQHLVSGSRDKTLRIWDLETRRSIRILEGHKGSVLCLQFDASPENDLIASGSSDSNVFLWRFSTGEVIQRLRHAHTESVLNLKFDDRILVTCSKDKLVRIFNRKPMSTQDPNHPKFSEVPVVVDNYAAHHIPPVIDPAWTNIATLAGHGAAVNAVQIYDDEIVTASGDRSIKIWNWRKEDCVRTVIGHTKGIACVQYDGRRIVSGSSDHDVKIFCKETGIDVATLRGHSDLVRTLQAGFGDPPHSVEDDERDARLTDERYFNAVDSGAIDPAAQQSRARARNAGSRDPEAITGYGARIPPGGGGGKYARIVSGSYDERIIIWRRDRLGIWKAQHILRQAEPDVTPLSQGPPPPAPAAPANPLLSMIGPNPLSPNNLNVSLMGGVAAGPAVLAATLRARPLILSLPNFPTLIQGYIDSSPQHQRVSLQAVANAAIHVQQAYAMQLISFHPPPAIALASITAPPGYTGGAAAVLPPTGHPAMPAVQAPMPHHHHHRHVARDTARIFKLQFDARRIICCNQSQIITGWDFANDDPDIIAACRFFAPVE